MKVTVEGKYHKMSANVNTERGDTVEAMQARLQASVAVMDANTAKQIAEIKADPQAFITKANELKKSAQGMLAHNMTQDTRDFGAVLMGRVEDMRRAWRLAHL